jgi:hypothetical protein
MTALDLFALLVLVVMGVAVVGGLILLAMLPGRIARERGHPHADAVAVCGWWGLITLGILLPLAWIWAFTWPPGGVAAASKQAAEPSQGGDES